MFVAQINLFYRGISSCTFSMLCHLVNVHASVHRSCRFCKYVSSQVKLTGLLEGKKLVCCRFSVTTDETYTSCLLGHAFVNGSHHRRVDIPFHGCGHGHRPLHTNSYPLMSKLTVCNLWNGTFPKQDLWGFL